MGQFESSAESSVGSRDDVPPVMKITFPERSGMASGLKEAMVLDE